MREGDWTMGAGRGEEGAKGIERNGCYNTNTREYVGRSVISARGD